MMNDPVIIASASAALSSAMGLFLGLALGGHSSERQETIIRKLTRESELASADILQKSIKIAELAKKVEEADKLSESKKNSMFRIMYDMAKELGLTVEDFNAWVEKKKKRDEQYTVAVSSKDLNNQIYEAHLANVRRQNAPNTYQSLHSLFGGLS